MVSFAGGSLKVDAISDVLGNSCGINLKGDAERTRGGGATVGIETVAHAVFF